MRDMMIKKEKVIPLLRLTLNPNLSNRAVSAFIAAANHQLIISNLRHGEVHEMPASGVNIPVDVARFPEHDLGKRAPINATSRGNKKVKSFHTYLVV